jgi:hypothetical protein
MPLTTVTEKKIISYHQQTKDGLRHTQIVSVTVDPNPDSEQLSLFNEDTWKKEMLQTIRRQRFFYPSEIRLLCKTIPPNDNMAGPFYHNLIKDRKIKKTGHYRKSICSIRKGGIEFEYENISV